MSRSGNLSLTKKRTVEKQCKAVTQHDRMEELERQVIGDILDDEFEEGERVLPGERSGLSVMLSETVYMHRALER